MSDTFTWTNDNGAERLHAPRIREHGWQRAADGLNTNLQKWGLAFSSRTPAESQAIDAFLAAHDGVAFLWTPPGGTDGLYVCESWSVTVTEYALRSLTATFREVPA